MKFKFIVLVLLILSLVACTAGAGNPTAIPTANLGNNGGAATPVPNPNPGGATASGVIVADQEAHMAFRLAGNVKLINVAAGDQVQVGQVLIKLDDTTQQIMLDQANLALQELTSPSALAAAQQTVAQDQQDLYNAEVALNNLQTQYSNQGLISNTHASLILAQNALKDAQTAYDETPGDQNRDPAKARAYQKLYAAQQSYDYALYIYNLYTGKPNQPQVDEATAKVALAKAKTDEDQTLVTALTGGTLPANPSGTGYASLMEAKFNVQAAQASLDATRLVAPFSGEVASVTTSMGDYVSPGQVILVISDVRHLHVETTDLSERDVPKVKLGQAVTVSVKALNQAVTGKVTVISPLADTLGGDVVYTVTIVLDDLPSNLRAGMSVDVQFNTGP